MVILFIRQELIYIIVNWCSRAFDAHSRYYCNLNWKFAQSEFNWIYDSREMLLRVVTLFHFHLMRLVFARCCHRHLDLFFLLLNMQLFLIAWHMRYADKKRARVREKENVQQEEKNIHIFALALLHFPYCSDLFWCTIHKIRNPHWAHWFYWMRATRVHYTPCNRVLSFACVCEIFSFLWLSVWSKVLWFYAHIDDSILAFMYIYIWEVWCLVYSFRNGLFFRKCAQG